MIWRITRMSMNAFVGNIQTNSYLEQTDFALTNDRHQFGYNGKGLKSLDFEEKRTFCNKYILSYMYIQWNTGCQNYWFQTVWNAHLNRYDPVGIEAKIYSFHFWHFRLEHFYPIVKLHDVTWRELQFGTFFGESKPIYIKFISIFFRLEPLFCFLCPCQTADLTQWELQFGTLILGIEAKIYPFDF